MEEGEDRKGDSLRREEGRRGEREAFQSTMRAVLGTYRGDEEAEEGAAPTSGAPAAGA